mmetsp:Transcript_16443/g.38398  ORF Transcript_16443/g.38398 Transcript_16443/m.38398 type:complete len:329 (-) Transcript_16443:71-1057(-)
MAVLAASPACPTARRRTELSRHHGSSWDSDAGSASNVRVAESEAEVAVVEDEGGWKKAADAAVATNLPSSTMRSMSRSMKFSRKSRGSVGNERIDPPSTLAWAWASPITPAPGAGISTGAPIRVGPTRRAVASSAKSESNIERAVRASASPGMQRGLRLPAAFASVRLRLRLRLRLRVPDAVRLAGRGSSVRALPTSTLPLPPSLPPRPDATAGQRSWSVVSVRPPLPLPPPRAGSTSSSPSDDKVLSGCSGSIAVTGPVLSGRSSRTATPSRHATDMKDLRNLASYGERWNTKPDAMAPATVLKLLFCIADSAMAGLEQLWGRQASS